MKTLLLLTVATLVLAACSEASVNRSFNYGPAGRVTCYSGGQIIFDDYSTGSIKNSNGYYFIASSTGRLVSASGDCTIDFGATQPQGFTAIRAK